MFVSFNMHRKTLFLCFLLKLYHTIFASDNCPHLRFVLMADFVGVISTSIVLVSLCLSVCHKSVFCQNAKYDTMQTMWHNSLWTVNF